MARIAPAMHQAGLYESTGYLPIEPYVEEPLEGTLYLGVELPS